MKTTTTDRARMRLYYQENRAAAAARMRVRYARVQRWMKELRSKPCRGCRKKYPHYMMEFDHVRGKKLFRIGNGMGQSLVSLQREIAKCDVVCANCHRRRTWQRARR